MTWVTGPGAAINPSDGSIWACIGDSVYHYSTNNDLLSKTELWWPTNPCVNAIDGSCWIIETGLNSFVLDTLPASLVHLAADGTALREVTGFNQPEVSTLCGPDGSVWVADHGVDASGELRLISSVGITLAALTSVAGQTGRFYSPQVNPVDGTSWAIFAYTTGSQSCEELIHVGVTGDLL